MSTEQKYAAEMMQHLDTTVTLRLVTVLQDIEAANDAAHIPFYDSINQTLSFMLTPGELEGLSIRDIPVSWLTTVSEATEGVSVDA